MTATGSSSSPKPVFLTLDLFFRPVKGKHELWACVQPHVLFDDLESWVRDSNGSKAGASNWQYQLWARQFDPGQVVPVCFRDNDDLLLTLDDVVVLDTSTRRSLAVDKPELLAARNRPPRPLDQTQRRKQPEAPIQHLQQNEAFAIGYTRALREALGVAPSGKAEKASVADLATMLKLAFWGGARRIVPDDCIPELRNTPDWSAMRLESIDDGNTTVTNLHSLLGLMGRLAATDGFDALANSRTLAIKVNGVEDPNHPRVDYSRFFAALPGALPQLGEDTVTLSVSGDHGQRVYVQDIGTAFTHQGESQSPFFGRLRTHGSEVSDTAAQPHLLSEVRAGAVLLQKDSPYSVAWHNLVNGRRNSLAADQALLDHLSTRAAMLTFDLYDTYEATIAPFRNVPVPGDGKGCVQTITLAPRDAKRLSAALENQPDLLSEAQYLDRDGKDCPLQPLQAAGTKPPGLLVFGQPVEGGSLLIRAKDPSAPTLTARLRGYPLPAPGDRNKHADLESLGLRWELVLPNHIPDLHMDFDLLKCTSDLSSLALAASDAKQASSLIGDLVPVLFFRSDVTFQYAQSVESIEGALTVTYPLGDAGREPSTPAPATPEPLAEYEDDLINHNALNVYTQWGESDEVHQSPWSENYPVSSEVDTDANARMHRFVFSYPFALDVPHTDAGDALNAPEFFKLLYDRMTRPRQIRFELEHTYGTRIDFGVQNRLDTSAHASFPPAMPTRVTRARPPIADKLSPDAFLTIGLAPDRAPAAGDDLNDESWNDRAILRFETRWLADPGADADRDLHRAAWRSVAELAYAEKCILHVRLLKFDSRQAMAKKGKLNLAEALVEAEEIPSVNITDELRDWARQWLMDKHPKADELTFNLTQAPPRIFQRCNIAEFELEVKRYSNFAPADHPRSGGDWHLVRPSSTVGPAGQQMQRATGLDRVFEAWQLALRGARDPICARAADIDRAELVEGLERLMGSRQQSYPGSWIVPRGLQQVDEQGVSPKVCPLAFRPLRHHPELGEDTFAVLAAYLKALADFCDGRIPQWKGKESSVWQSWTKDRRPQGFEALIRRMAEIAWPVPGMNSAVGDLVARLRGDFSQRIDGPPATEPTNPDKTFRLRLEAQLRENPQLFVAAKAFLVTDIESRVDDGGLFCEYFRMRSVKRIREQSDGSPALDRDLFTFRQAFKDASDDRHLYHAEVLEDAVYDNQFHFECFALETFESALESLHGSEREPALLSGQHLPLLNDRLRLPAGEQQIDRNGMALGAVGSAARVPVFLASRETLRPPQHEWTGMMPQMQSDDAGMPDAYLESELIRGMLKARQSASHERAVRLAGLGAVTAKDSGSTHFPRSQRMDDFVLSALFRIDPDEEGAFTNDVFHVQVQSTAGESDSADDNDRSGESGQAGNSDTALEKLDKESLNLFKTLKEKASDAPLSDDDLMRVVSDDVIADVIKLLVPIEPLDLASRGAEEFLSFRIDPNEAASDGQFLEIPIETNAGASVQPRAAEVLVLRSVPDASASAEDREPSVWVMVNVELPVWNRWSLSLRQERNPPTSPDRPGRADFALEFGQSSQVIRDSSAYQPVVVEPPDGDTPRPAVNLTMRVDSSRRIDIKDLMDAVLVDVEPPRVRAGAAGAQPWVDFDLSLTLSQRQLVNLPVISGEDKADETYRLQDSSFPLSNYRWGAQELAAGPDAREHSVQFDPQHEDFVLEFQWTSPSNLPFFRIQQVFVTVQGGA